MRALLVIAVLLAMLGVVAAGGKQHQSFAGPSPLQKLTLPVKYENLPEETMPTKMLEDVVKTKYVDQDIIQPKTIKQPIIQQRLVEQPIVRTRIVHQPILRRVYTKNVVRPHVIAQERLQPLYKQQDVLVPKIVEQTIVKEEFSQKQHARPTATMPATFSGKSRQQLYGNPSFSEADPPMGEASANPLLKFKQSYNLGAESSSSSQPEYKPEEAEEFAQ
jgi:hypothetical protein